MGMSLQRFLVLLLETLAGVVLWIAVVRPSARGYPQRWVWQGLGGLLVVLLVVLAHLIGRGL